MRDIRLWLALAGLSVGGYLLASQVTGGDGSAPVTDDELTTLVFVCRDTGELFVGKSRSTPAERPDNGRPTLLPGWYCGECRTWHTGPALDEWQRRPTPVLCPKTKKPLERTGPSPDGATKI
jgi:hypothetical protein